MLFGSDNYYWYAYSLLMVPMIILAITIIFITLNSYVCHFCIALNMVLIVVVFIIFAISILVMMVQ